MPGRTGRGFFCFRIDLDLKKSGRDSTEFPYTATQFPLLLILSSSAPSVTINEPVLIIIN